MKPLASFFMIFLLAACSVPDTRIYSLNLSSGNRDAGGSTDPLVISVTAVPYLSQPYIVSRTSPYELEVSKYAKWDAAPAELAKSALKENLSGAGLFREVKIARAAAGDSFFLRMELKRFERIDLGREPFGEISLDFELFSPDGKLLSRGAITKKALLDDREYRSLAKGMSLVLSEAVEEVRADVTRAIAKKQL
ncbi:MAG TPA: ABC-type transport auxiliary lipoprotein family protein [Dissulfurispiraceae bacterium]